MRFQVCVGGGVITGGAAQSSTSYEVRPLMRLEESPTVLHGCPSAFAGHRSVTQLQLSAPHWSARLRQMRNASLRSSQAGLALAVQAAAACQRARQPTASGRSRSPHAWLQYRLERPSRPRYQSVGRAEPDRGSPSVHRESRRLQSAAPKYAGTHANGARPAEGWSL